MARDINGSAGFSLEKDTQIVCDLFASVSKVQGDRVHIDNPLLGLEADLVNVPVEPVNVDSVRILFIGYPPFSQMLPPLCKRGLGKSECDDKKG